MISDTLIAGLKKSFAKTPPIWDGRKAIMEMRDANYPHWRQMEWIGFYFQFLCEKQLFSIMKMPGPKFGKVEFDGFAGIPFDFKAHPAKNANDQMNTSVIVNDR